MEIQKALDELKALKIDYNLDLGIDFEKAQSEINQALKLQKTGVSDSFYHDDEDSLLDYWLESQPDLTEEEEKQKLEESNKCADFILKNKITPNMDSVY